MLGSHLQLFHFFDRFFPFLMEYNFTRYFFMKSLTDRRIC
uniref:Uncharacterized protein n=1 Tax=Aegilops tauschii subsp. strangulata TaxID=200361 RepID=A0A453JRK8_AEGTS